MKKGDLVKTHNDVYYRVESARGSYAELHKIEHGRLVRNSNLLYLPKKNLTVVDKVTLRIPIEELEKFQRFGAPFDYKHPLTPTWEKLITADTNVVCIYCAERATYMYFKYEQVVKIVKQNAIGAPSLFVKLTRLQKVC